MPEFVDMRLSVIGPLAIGVGMMDNQSEVWTASTCRPMQHLQIAI